MGALQEYCLADKTIFGLVEDRVYINEIPRATVEAAPTFHPPKMLVLRMAGGSGKADRLPIDRPTVSAVCYGEDQEEADKVRRAVWTLFDDTLRQSINGVLFHWINPSGGPFPNTEKDLVWPIVAQSFAILADVREAA